MVVRHLRLPTFVQNPRENLRVGHQIQVLFEIQLAVLVVVVTVNDHLDVFDFDRDA